MMGVIQFPTRAATHGQRDTAGDILPAGGTARPVPPPSGRADQFDADGYARRCDEPAHFIDLRDGGLVEPDEWPWWAGLFWIAMLAAGLAFWGWIGGPLLFWCFDMIAGRLQ